MDHHGGPGYFVIGQHGIDFVTVVAEKVKEYTRAGKVSGGYGNEIATYLLSLSVIASGIAEKGNFIFTACEAGQVNGGNDLARALYENFASTNASINVLLNNDFSRSFFRSNNISLQLDEPLSTNRGSLGWSVANNQSRTRDSRTGLGDLQLNRTGRVVEFSSEIYKLLNR